MKYLTLPSRKTQQGKPLGVSIFNGDFFHSNRSGGRAPSHGKSIVSSELKLNIKRVRDC